jgi:hypothetical protein
VSVKGQSHVQDAITARIEVAAKAVTEAACKAPVKLVRTISAKQVEKEDVNYKNMAVLEFKKREMEQQQVEILCVWRGNLVLPDMSWGRCVVVQGITRVRQTNEFGL